jgi:hypothetical protein
MDHDRKRKLDPDDFYNNRTATSIEQKVLALKSCTRKCDNFWTLGKTWIEPDKVLDAYKVWFDYSHYYMPELIPAAYVKKCSDMPTIDSNNKFQEQLLGKHVMLFHPKKQMWIPGKICGFQRKQYSIKIQYKGFTKNEYNFNHDLVKLLLE